jgi:hypothetical protein
MFDKNFYGRIEAWRELRDQVETSNNPFDLVKSFWNKAPLVNFATDPYDKSTWPDPWEMILQNEYCDFMKVLASFYTLQLTERFSQSHFEIHIVLDDKESRMKYFLLVDNQPFGYYNDTSIDKKDISIFSSQVRHVMQPIT